MTMMCDGPWPVVTYTYILGLISLEYAEHLVAGVRLAPVCRPVAAPRGRHTWSSPGHSGLGGLTGNG